ncbi:MAG: UPF0175 family protein [Acidobacteria bacterium]|nr:UPF0175 family protein [Acidobacteriota bacterium]
MNKRVILDFELPGEVVEKLRGKDLTTKVKEALVMELLREHSISQGKAAELLGLPREELFSLMAKYQVPVVDLDPAELQAELNKTLPDNRPR